MAAVGNSARVRSRLSGSIVPVIEKLEERINFGTIPNTTPPNICRTCSGGAGNGPVGPVTIGPLKNPGYDSSESYSEAPVRYSDGVMILQATDLQSFGFGSEWGLTRSWTNQANPYHGAVSKNAPGNKWFITQIPRLMHKFRQAAYDRLVLETSATDSQAFEATTNPYSNDLQALYKSVIGSEGQLVRDDVDSEDLENPDYLYTNPSGEILRFHNPGPIANPPAEIAGRLMSLTDAGGRVTRLHYDGNNRIDEIYREETVGGQTVRESYFYAYRIVGALTTDFDYRFFNSVTLARKVGTNAATTVRKVEYEYYDNTDLNLADDSDGTTGDLKTATVKDGSGNIINSDYYRYYIENIFRNSVRIGYAGGLKYVLTSKSFDRLMAYRGSRSAVFTSTDSQVATFADHYFEYDTNQRVTKEIAQGEGCSLCSNGQGAFAFSYQNEYFADSLEFNKLAHKTIETLPDGNQNVVYTNFSGEPILKIQRDVTKHVEWRTYWRYDEMGRVILKAEPSAVENTFNPDEHTYDDIIGYDSGTGDFAYLKDNSGVVHTYDFYDSTDGGIDEDTAGGVDGYIESIKIQRGDGGGAPDPIPLSDFDYFQRSISGGATVYALAHETEYSDEAGSDSQTTTYGYTFLSGQTRVESVTISHPLVAVLHNGSVSADADTTFYDIDGRPIWTKDAAGRLTYMAYDPVTGSLLKRIVDVDTDNTGDFTAKPSGWNNASGLHLISLIDVDPLGRTIRKEDPNHNVTYIIYDDTTDDGDAREVRVYPGWNSSTFSTTGPAILYRDDRATSHDSYVETVTISMGEFPHDLSGRPDGSEQPDDTGVAVHSVLRDYYSDAGQLLTEDRYSNLPTPWTASATYGTSGVNFHRARYDYNDRGQLNRVVHPTGTIERYIYDRMNHLVSLWIGTDDTPATGDWSPDNNVDANMTRVREYVYDNGLTGDGNVTRVVDHVGGSEIDRVTKMYYDWRDRRVAVKQGSVAKLNFRLTPTWDYLFEGEVFSVAITDSIGTTSFSFTPESQDVADFVSYVVNQINAGGGQFDAVTATADGSTIVVAGNDPNHSFTIGLTSSASAGNRVSFALTPLNDTLVESDSANRLLTYSTYNNLNQVMSQELFKADGIDLTADSTPADGVPDRPALSNRRAETTSEYDDRGRIFGSHVYSISASTGSRTTSNSLSSYRWYDQRGNVAKTLEPGGIAHKYTYDGAGRLSKEYSSDASGDAAAGASGNWADAMNVDGDLVLTQTETQYDANGNIIFTINKERFHDAAGTGELGSPTHSTTDSISPARSSYAEYYYDAIDRLTGTANLGTSGGTILSAPPDSAVPTRSDTKLVTTYAYDNAGRLYTVIDPRGIETRSYYDALGRTSKTIEAYVDGSPDNSDDRTTQYTYDGSDHVLTMKAVLPDGPDSGTALDEQITEYVYGVSTDSGSAINSNDLLFVVKYPDKSTGAASEGEEEGWLYNAQGQHTLYQDRNGTIHDYTYDPLGRLVTDAVTLGSGVNGTVRRLETAYDDAGRPFLFTSYSAAAGGTIVNQVQRAYNGLGQLVTEYQSHSDAVNTSTTPKVQYTYSEMSGGANHSRLTKVTYPDGRIVRYEYSSGIDSDISRLSFLADDSSGSVGAHLEEYSYLGLGTVIKRAHPQSGVELTYIMQTGESAGEAGDQYTGLDRFGRIVDQRWLKTSDGSAAERFTSTYDRDSNRRSKINVLNDELSELYLYDRLNRLVQRIVIGDFSDEKVDLLELWDYDALGNMTSTSRTVNALPGDANLDGTVDALDYTAIDANLPNLYAWWRLGDLSVDGTTAMDDYAAIDANISRTGGGVETLVFRTHNAQNQITELGGATSFTYDASGNLTADDDSQSYTYDAWGRMITAGAMTYGYDALGRKVTTNDGTTATHLYYSDQWQVVEEREGTATVAKRQYVWSSVYVDAMVERDQDSGTDGTLDERSYAQQDANFNVMSVIDTSGTVVERYTYEAFGQFTVIDADWSSDADGVSDVGWVYLHQGGRLDTITGLYDFRNREYSADLGRWMQQDPMGYVDGENLYQYEVSRPTTGLDPRGLAWIPYDPFNPYPFQGVPGLPQDMIDQLLDHCLDNPIEYPIAPPGSHPPPPVESPINPNPPEPYDLKPIEPPVATPPGGAAGGTGAAAGAAAEAAALAAGAAAATAAIWAVCPTPMGTNDIINMPGYPSTLGPPPIVRPPPTTNPSPPPVSRP